MQYVRLGSTGLKVSRIALGMLNVGNPEWHDWVLDEASATPVVRRAVDAGIIFFDTSDVYSCGASEEITGNLLRKFFARREDYVLATKVRSPTGPGLNDRGLSRKRVFAAIDDSLRRLGTARTPAACRHDPAAGAPPPRQPHHAWHRTLTTHDRVSANHVMAGACTDIA